jgi:hypothetical protein
MVDDAAIRADIADRLRATGEFDDVLVSDASRGCDSGGSFVAEISPFGGDSRGHDDSPASGLLIQSERATLTITVRHEDQELRDKAAKRLLDVAANAINGVSLAGITYVHVPVVQSWKWKDATPPERRLEVTLKYMFDVPGWQSFDTTE